MREAYLCPFAQRNAQATFRSPCGATFHRVALFFCLKTGATGPPCQAFNLERNGRKLRKGTTSGPGGAARAACLPIPLPIISVAPPQ